MRGNRPLESNEVLLDDWAWTHPTYSFEWPVNQAIESIEIDPLRKTADVNRKNNSVRFDSQKTHQFLRH